MRSIFCLLLLLSQVSMADPRGYCDQLAQLARETAKQIERGVSESEYQWYMIDFLPLWPVWYPDIGYKEIPAFISFVYENNWNPKEAYTTVSQGCQNLTESGSALQ